MPRAVSKPAASRLRLLVPLLLASVVIVLGAAYVRHTRPTVQAASDVRRDVIEIVSQGGFLGPFQVRCEVYTISTGEFVNFIAETDDLIVSAPRARVQIDPHADTVAIELFDAVVMRVPASGESRDVALQRLERYTLGPFPYELDIIEE